jgi:caffeoyl-CoA O-methyltransferase
MLTYNQAISDFIGETFVDEDEKLKRIRTQTVERGLPDINISPEEGRFLQFLVASTKSQLVLEIGTLGGYSGTWIAHGLPEGGQLITLEKEPRHAEVAREHFRLAGVDDKVELLEGDAKELLQDLESHYSFDLVFIDAEKEDYPFYLDWSLQHLGSGGIIAAHNAFRHGAILDEAEDDSRVVATRRFLAQLAGDNRVIATIYPAGDGIAIGVMR